MLRLLLSRRWQTQLTPPALATPAPRLPEVGLHSSPRPACKRPGHFPACHSPPAANHGCFSRVPAKRMLECLRISSCSVTELAESPCFCLWVGLWFHRILPGWELTDNGDDGSFRNEIDDDKIDDDEMTTMVIVLVAVRSIMPHP